MHYLTTFIRHLWGEKRTVAGHWLVATLGLVILVSLLAGIILPPAHYLTTHERDPYFGVVVDKELSLDFDEALALARRLDALRDKIEAQDPAWLYDSVPDTDEAILAQMWQAELAPMYQYEGLARRIVFPRIVHAIASSGYDHNHLGGRSNCADAYALNIRYINPVSHWYDRNWLAVLAHELAHNHQGPDQCSADRTPKERAMTEATAQLMSWEVLASLANKGNEIALYSFIDTVLGDVLGTAEAYALSGTYGGDAARFDRELKDIYGGDAARWASHQKSRRFFADHPEDLARILNTYSALPVNLLATYRHGGEIPDMALDTDSRRLRIDDILYTLAHAEELVEAALG